MDCPKCSAEIRDGLEYCDECYTYAPRDNSEAINDARKMGASIFAGLFAVLGGLLKFLFPIVTLGSALIFLASLTEHTLLLIAVGMLAFVILRMESKNKTQ